MKRRAEAHPRRPAATRPLRGSGGGSSGARRGSAWLPTRLLRGLWRYKDVACAVVACVVVSQVLMFLILRRSLGGVGSGAGFGVESGSALVRKHWSARTIEMNARLIRERMVSSVAGNSTIFVLRIQKAGSSQSERLFGMLTFEDSHRDELRRASPSCQVFADCSPWTVRNDMGLVQSSLECHDRAYLMHYGHPKGQTGVKRKAWRGLARRDSTLDVPVADCIPFLYSYCFVERYHSKMTAEEKHAVRGYLTHARMVSGHFKYGVHEVGHRKGGYLYVTALRDPIRRVLSQWNWWCTLAGREMIHLSTFDQWLRSELRWRNPSYGYYMLTNHMTRVLCGRSLGTAPPGRELPFEDERRGMHELEPMTRAHLECAKSNLLRDFALVVVLEMLREEPGLTEELQTMIAQLMLGVPEHWMRTGLNPNKTPMGKTANQVRKEELTIWQIGELQRLNQLDFELHDFSRILFARQIKEWRRLHAAQRGRF